MRVVALDVGSRRIGVAATDEAGIAAHPLQVLERAGTAADVAAVLEIVARLEASILVVGVPYELSGREGLRAKRVRVLIDALAAALPAGVRLAEQDERFTTAEAERVMLDAGVRHAQRKDVIDKQAAALILQAWLDAAPAAG